MGSVLSCCGSDPRPSVGLSESDLTHNHDHKVDSKLQIADSMKPLNGDNHLV